MANKLAQLISARRKRSASNKRTAKRVPVSLLPASVERSYAKELLGFVKVASQIMQARLMPFIRANFLSEDSLHALDAKPLSGLSSVMHGVRIEYARQTRK